MAGKLRRWGLPPATKTKIHPIRAISAGPPRFRPEIPITLIKYGVVRQQRRFRGVDFPLNFPSIGKKKNKVLQ